MLGLLHVLRAAGRPYVASFSEPFGVAPHYRELPGLELLVPPAEFPERPEVMVTFDSGALTVSAISPTPPRRRRSSWCSIITCRTSVTAAST